MGGKIRWQTTSKFGHKPACEMGRTLNKYILNFDRNGEGESNYYDNTGVEERIILKQIYNKNEFKVGSWIFC